MRISGFGLRQAEVETRGGGHVPCQADYLKCVGIGRNGSRHKADSPFHAIPKVSRILDASTVLMMSMNKGINAAHHYYPILEASQESLGDQVLEEMVPSRKLICLLPDRSKHVVQIRTLVVVR